MTQVRVLADELNRALRELVKVAPARVPLPVCQNVLLERDGALLKITATDLEQALAITLGAQAEDGDFALTVPARLLADAVRPLREGIVTLTQTAPDKLTLECGSMKLTLAGTKADEFPPIPACDGAAVKVAAQPLRDMLKRVAFCAASECTRPVLTGIKCETREQQLVTAAADAFRLAVDAVQLAEPPAADINVIVPARTLKTLSGLLGRSSATVEWRISQQGTQAHFAWDGITLTTQLVMGTFPAYEKLIPPAGTARIGFDCEAMKRTLEAAAPFAKEGSGIVRLMWQDGALVVGARAEETGEFRHPVAAMLEGDPQAKVAFNSLFLNDLFRWGMPDGPCVLEVSGPSSPGLFWCPETPAYRHVIMPMFVQW